MPPDRLAAGDDVMQAQREMDTPRAESGRTEQFRAETTRAELGRTVASQLVETVRHGPGGSTDVALNPEELGRVRLSLQTQDGVLHVTVVAERPETHDLIRRNIGLLQADFRALGYTDVAFDFGAGGEQSNRPDRPAERPRDGPLVETQGDTAAAAAAPAADTRAGAASTRLDLRL
jgi:hypothetical protein